MRRDEPLDIGETTDKEEAPPENPEAEWDQYLNVPASNSLPVGDGPGEEKPAGAGENPNDVADPYPDGDIIMMATDADLMTPIETKLEGLARQLTALQKEFRIKIKNDAHKDTVIDHLHQELQQYKNNHLRKYLLPTLLDIIQFIDGLRKLIRYLTIHRPEENEAQKLMKMTKLLKSIPSDLEDICAKQGITSFQCNETVFNPSRQSILKKVHTIDMEKDKTVAESLRPGYEWAGEVIRPELVSVYIHKAPEVEKETRNADE